MKSSPSQPIEARGRILTGTVVRDAMKKTVVVEVSRLKMNLKYQKQVPVTDRYQAHDEQNEYHVGDRVTIRESRPLSKCKRWIVIGKVSEQ